MPEEWFESFDEGLWLKVDTGADAEAEFIRHALRLEPQMQVLDAPCGAGRIAVHLARAGCGVAGVDRCDRFVARAQERFQHEGLRGRFVVGDLRRIAFREEFDAVLNWGGSFGYFSPDAGNLDVLRRLAASLRPGGRLLLDQPSREALLRHFRATLDVGSRTMHNRWDAARERLESTWVARGAEGGPPSEMSMRLYTPAQLRALFRRAGLIPEAAYGGPDGSAYGRASRRLILVARRPGAEGKGDSDE